MNAEQPRHLEFGGNATNVVQAGQIFGGVHVHNAPTPIDTAASALARAVSAQWRAEAALQGLVDPAPIAVDWVALGGSALADHPCNVGGEVSGRSDQVGALAESFCALQSRRLVVLGEPGSGKTSLATLLLLTLLDDHQTGAPVPVLMSMSTWDPWREHVHSWLARRLHEDYPVLRSQGLDAAAQQLVANRRVLPVLDGLDELSQAHRGAALAALNQMLTADDPLVLTCRSSEYRQAVGAGHVLTAAALVEARPVRLDAAIAHLHATTSPGQLHRWHPLFNHLRSQPNSALAQTLSSPLMISLARGVYADPARQPDELRDERWFPHRWALEDFLLDAFVSARYRDRPRPPEPDRKAPPAVRYSIEQSRRWLAFLARQLHQSGTQDLAWWNLKHAVSRGGMGLFAGLLMAAGMSTSMSAFLMVVHAYVFAGKPLVGALALLVPTVFQGFLWGIVGVVVTGYRVGKPKPPSQLTIKFNMCGKDFGLVLLRMLVRGCAFPLLLMCSSYLVIGFLFVPRGTINLVRRVWSWLSMGLKAPIPLLDVRSPMSALRSDRSLATTLAITLGFAMLSLTTVFSGLLGVLYGLTLAVPIGIAIAVNTAWGMFVLVRWLLVLRGRLPLRVMRFLEDAHRRGILRKVGAVYQFRHARLQEHLAFDRSRPQRG